MNDQFANTVLNKLFELSTKIDVVATTVKRHDDITFPEMQKNLKEQGLTLKRIESKHNQDYLQYVEAKENIEKRIEPLEEHLKNHKEIKAEDKKVWVEITKHAISLIIGAVSTLIGINLNK